MPFPWKKNRVTRISQIVADLQSPKRGGSLVVETGFPTSLIDLFVKNRSRFRKHRSKRPLQPDIPDPPPPPPSPVTTPPSQLEPQLTNVEVPTPRPQIEQNDEVAAVPGRVIECSFGSSIIMGCVKILMVLVLVASVKRLTVGITMSAFALLFLEYAGKRVVSCPNVKPLSQRVLSTCVWFQKLLFLRLKDDKETVQGGGSELRSGSLSIDEIEVEEAKSEVGVCCELGFLGGDVAYLGIEEFLEDDFSKGKVLDPSCEISECKIRGSRSGRFMKSKMVKKLVPKKFRGSKKEKKEKGSKHYEGESGSEVSSGVGDDKLPSLEIEEVAEDVVKDENGDRLIKTKKLKCIRDDEVDCGMAFSHESRLAKAVGVKRVDRVGNSGSIVLVMVALSGLLLGRFQALILSMTWCCLIKIFTSLWRSRNVSLIKCSVSNS